MRLVVGLLISAAIYLSRGNMKLFLQDLIFKILSRHYVCFGWNVIIPSKIRKVERVYFSVPECLLDSLVIQEWDGGKHIAFGIEEIARAMCSMEKCGLVDQNSGRKILKDWKILDSNNNELTVEEARLKYI